MYNLNKAKKYFWLIPFLLFTGLTYFVNEDHSLKDYIPVKSNDEYYLNGLAKKEFERIDFISDYTFDVFFQELYDKIIVNEQIIWRNKTEFPTGEMQFHLYANAYKNNRTLFSSSYNITPDAQTYFEIDSVSVNGKRKNLIYFQPDVDNPYDSTVAKIELEKPVLPGDSVIVNFHYKLKIPISVKRFGKARGADFYFISQWFPKVGVFEKGKWVCNQYFPRLNFYSDFGRYDVKINLPEKYRLGSTGLIKKKYTANGRTTFEVVQDGVHDFAWMFASDIIDTSEVYLRKDGSKINVRMLLQPGREKYTERYFNSTIFTLKYFEENIGEYPYEQVTIVDCPRTSASGGMEYPTLFTVGAALFEPEDTHYPEKLVIHEFIHQYFYGILANNEASEAWLDEGFTSYFASKVTKEFFQDDGYLTFRSFGYLPIFGINFFAYYEIPIIYSLGFFEYPEEGRAIKRYYRDKTTGAIADTSYTLPNDLSYVINAYSKPELMLHSLERVIGEKRFINIVGSYFEKFKFKHPKSIDFINAVKMNVDEEIDWFFDEIFYGSKIFDDRIRYVRQISPYDYEIFVERLGDGKFHHDIWCYTEEDTIKLRWDSPKRYKIFRIKTDTKLRAVEIDPLRKNLFDLNFSNNSYTLEKKYWGTASISIKWYFWIQNALMILGSIG